MTTTTHLALTPRDGFFIKDGRGWHTSASGRAHGLDWPWPSTIQGALRTIWGISQEAHTQTIFTKDDWLTQTRAVSLGRTLALRRPVGAAWQPEHIVWPVGLDAIWYEGETRVQFLDPCPPIAPTLGRNEDEAREKLWRPLLTNPRKPLRAPRWWTHAEFVAWLSGETPPVSEALALPQRVQVHVGIDPATRTGRDGIVFSHDVMETLEQGCEWSIGAEVSWPARSDSPVAMLGSSRRIASVEALPEGLFDAPQPLLDAFARGSSGLRLLAVSPLLFAHGWLPDGLSAAGDEFRGHIPGIEAEVVLRAAYVPRPVPISGWNMADDEPKTTTRAVPPGAVYFFERADGAPFTRADAQALWLSALGARTGDGFGRVVPGVWNPQRTT